jgi:hypothetical protein
MTSADMPISDGGARATSLRISDMSSHLLRATRAGLLVVLVAAGCAPAADSSPGPGPNTGGTGGGGSGGSPPPTTGKDAGPADLPSSPPADGPPLQLPPPPDAGPPTTSDGPGGPGADTGEPPGPGSDAMPPSSGGDTPAGRPLMVDKANPSLHSFRFRPSEADPMASRRDETQAALLDTRAPQLRGKLVVTLSGVGGAPGPMNVANFAAGLGFHVFAVAYENSVNPSTQNNPRFFGDMRFEQFDGMDRGNAVTVARPDCVEVRVQKALALLKTRDPGGDWGYYLDGEGQVRWSDVIFMGHSHGASSAAAYAKIRRVWRAISLAGPRDTNPVVATWLSQPSATPIERYFGFTATGDAQHQDHLRAMETAKYAGAITTVEGAAAPYGGSHRLRHSGGHGDSANCARFADACRYMLGVEGP